MEDTGRDRQEDRENQGGRHEIAKITRPVVRSPFMGTVQPHAHNPAREVKGTARLPDDGRDLRGQRP